MSCGLSHREPLHSVQVLEVLVDQAGVLLHQVGLERPHHEAHCVSVQLAAQQLGQRLGRRSGQQLGTRRCVAAAACCVQGLAKLVGIGGLEVDGNFLASTVALQRRSVKLLVIVTLRREMQQDAGGLCFQWPCRVKEPNTTVTVAETDFFFMYLY